MAPLYRVMTRHGSAYLKNNELKPMKRELMRRKTLSKNISAWGKFMRNVVHLAVGSDCVVTESPLRSGPSTSQRHMSRLSVRHVPRAQNAVALFPQCFL